MYLEEKIDSYLLFFCWKELQTVYFNKNWNTGWFCRWVGLLWALFVVLLLSYLKLRISHRK